MTDPGHDPEQDAVRRLLAEARHDAPMPDDVRARLDDVLAGLTVERREVRATEPVVDLSVRRRQRRRTALLAAAAVVVAGVGLGQVLDTTGGADQMTGDATASRDDSASSESRESGDGAGAPEAEAEAPSTTSDSRSLGAQADLAVPAVRSTHLREDLRRVRPTSAAARLATPDLYPGHACAIPLAGAGELVPVTLDGDPAMAIFRPVSDGRQAVAVYACDSGEEIDRLWLRVR